MPPRSATDGIVLLHGLGRTRRSMAKMERALARAGFRTLNLDYPSRRAPLDALAECIRPAVDDFAAANRGALHFVTHSMGGLVVRVLLDRGRPARLGRVVMLGPPNQGSELADLLHGRLLYRMLFGPAGQQLTTGAAAALVPRSGVIDYPVGIIAGTRSIPIVSAWVLPGPSDGKVTVLRTTLDGMADHITVAGRHPWLMRHPVAIAQTITFLRKGRFERAEPARHAGHIR